MMDGLRRELRAARWVAGALVSSAVDRAADVARERLDELAFLWLMNRRDVDRGQAAELLEHLGAQVGARVELNAPP
jgi:hypothetical protein